MKQLETFFNLSTAQLVANPFFIEWVFCSQRADETVPPDLKIQDTHLLMPILQASEFLLNDTILCPLIDYSLMQYRLMKREFSSINSEDYDPLKKIELSFQVARLYWSIIQERLLNYQFKKPEHEVHFFKIIKPCFMAESEFFTLAYHALLFSNVTNTTDIENFWQREKHRKEKLLSEHKDFFSSYFHGCTEHNQIWFRRGKQQDNSSHDHLVASWYALERYGAFIEAELSKINNLDNDHTSN